MHLLKQIRKIAVGISGGVDSAVSAYILSKKYETVGVFMKNWDLIDETGVCSVENDLNDAQEVCKLLGIPFYEANFVKEYWTEVFDNLISDYKKGLTPNPDILCNKNIKFNRFIDFAFNKANVNTIATGHYARNIICDNFKPPGAKLLKAHDSIKDQTFFLSQISQNALCKTIFPIGNLLKSQVKEIAWSVGLERIAKKKESMGICFIGPRNFKQFIMEYIAPSKGNLIDIDSGKTVGQHFGKHSWTIGQRCKIGGFDDAYYIAVKTGNEDIFVAKGHNHPILFSDNLITEPAHWVHSEPINLSKCIFSCEFRFQHGKPLINCFIYKLKNNNLFIKLEKPLRALTPGQYAVFYKGNECLGSARIFHPGPSKYSLEEQIVKNIIY